MLNCIFLQSKNVRNPSVKNATSATLCPHGILYCQTTYDASMCTMHASVVNIIIFTENNRYIIGYIKQKISHEFASASVVIITTTLIVADQSHYIIIFHIFKHKVGPTPITLYMHSWDNTIR